MRLAPSYSVFVKNCGEVGRCEMICNFVLCTPKVCFILPWLSLLFYLVCFWFHAFLNREVNLNAVCLGWRESHAVQQQQTLSLSVFLTMQKH